MSAAGAGHYLPPLNAVPERAALDAYMTATAPLFSDDLFAIHSADARPAVQRLIADAVEATFVVFGPEVQPPSDAWAAQP